MKLTIVLLIAGSLHLSATGFGQKVSISGKDLSLEKVFTLIKKQTSYVFFYDYSIFQGARPVSLDLKDAEVEDVLRACLRDQNLDFSITNKTISITKKIENSAQNLYSFPVKKLIDIKGNVLNEKGDPLVGASVQVKGMRKGTETVKDGSFEIKQVLVDAVIQITFTGYEKKEIKVSEINSLVIILKISNSPLDEVHVVAYGTTTQRYNVGSVSKISSEDISSQPISNPLQALEGRIPGVYISQTSGLPGASIQIQVRGQNTLPSSPGAITPPLDQPFFIIDGVPFSPQNQNINQFSSIASPGNSPQYGNPYGGLSPFNSINPSDIESIEVLRDADATAIYGSRGANGVILITTKKGKVGKTKFGINISSGGSQITHTMPTMNTEQYLKMRYETFRNDGKLSLLIPQYAKFFPDLLLFDSTKYTDWKKYFLGGTANNSDVNSSISGGTANTQFLLGAGYHHESYIFPGDFSDNRVSFNANIHHSSVDQKLLVDFQLNYSYDKNTSSSSPNALKAFTLAPNFPNLINPNGSINWIYKGISLSSNPISYIKQPYSGQNYNLISHFQVGYEILSGLIIRSSFGYSKTDFNEYSAVPRASQNPAQNGSSSAAFGTNNFINWITEPQVELKKRVFNGVLNVILGGTFQKNINSSTQINASNYTDDALLGSIAAAGTIDQVSDNSTLYKYSAFFGRLNYIWQHKYVINLTGRRDGSSRFGPGRQFGNFSSISGGWIFSEETFIKENIKGISYGKLKASYGSTGNDNVGDYQYLANWKPTGLSYLGQTGLIPQNLYQPDFSWAVTKKLEVGLELGFLNDRLLANVEWYQNKCSNQLVSYVLPSQTGFTSVTKNFQAAVQNSGFELQISSVNIKNKDFVWATSFNLSIPRNKLIAFPNLMNSSYAYNYVLGQSLNVLNKIKLLGVNDTTGRYQFYTAKGIPTYTPVLSPELLGGDEHVIGTLDPKYFGGLKNTFSYKSIQLDIFLQFTKQIGPNYLFQIYSGNTVGANVNQPIAINDRWQKAGDVKNIQRFSQYDQDVALSASNFTYSNGAYSDASFIRFKTLNITYNFRQFTRNRLKIQGCKIYLNAQNLFIITGYKGNDPETKSYYGVPPLKTIVAGLQLTF